MNNIEKGKLGEELAKKYLVKKGYTILNMNYRNKIGEIDIIAKDKEVIVFIEVKTRTSTLYGYAYEAVDRRKQNKIMNTSYLYCKHNDYNDHQLRYDIIEVYLSKNESINHIIDAFAY